MNSALMLHRHARPAVAGSYALGAVSGAALTTTVLVVLNGLLSPVPATVRGVVAISLIGPLLLRALGVVRFALPQRRYQIPRDVFTPDPVSSAFRFALELGTGLRTFITASAPYALALTLALCLPIRLGPAILAAVGAAIGYGTGRTVVVGVQALRQYIAVEHPRAWLRSADVLATLTALAIAVDFVIRG